MPKPLLTFLLLVSSTMLLAQTMDDKSFRRAQKAFYQEDFEEALKRYHLELQVKSPTDLSRYQMEICSLLTDYRAKSLDKLLSFKRSFGKTDKFYYYWLGRIYFRRNNFPSAIESWEKFLGLKVYKSDYIVGETRAYINWAYEAQEFYQMVGEYKLEPMSEVINSPESEFSPVMTPDGVELLFISNRISGQIGEIYNVYRATKTKDSWTAPRLISYFGMFDQKNPDINYVRSRDQLFFYKGEFDVDLYFSQRSRNNWGDPLQYHEKVPIKRLESDFHINENKDIIIFGQYRKTRPYDMNLYVTRKNLRTGKWSKPQLFSANVASEEDENYPYLTADGRTLYFSSRGFGSIGGYDVFMSKYNPASGLWSLPIHLPYPINTIDDDIQYEVFDEEEGGFLVTDRMGGMGGYDIYRIDRSYNILLLVSVKDTRDRPVSGLHMEISSKEHANVSSTVVTNQNGEIETHVGSGQTFNISLFYNEQLVKRDSLVAPKVSSSDDVMQKAYVVDLEEFMEDKQTFVRMEDPVYEELGKIASKFRKSNRAIIPSIYFEFDNYFLKMEDREKLDPLVQSLNKNPSVRVEIAGHTDNVGDPAQNKRLSYLRANSVASYLIEKGIEKDRIEVRGYGASQPIASNDDEEEGRELNRRIEVVVLESKH